MQVHITFFSSKTWSWCHFQGFCFWEVILIWDIMPHLNSQVGFFYLCWQVIFNLNSWRAKYNEIKENNSFYISVVLINAWIDPVCQMWCKVVGGLTPPNDEWYTSNRLKYCAHKCTFSIWEDKSTMCYLNNFKWY